MQKCILVCACIRLCVSLASAETGDALVITANIVNLRSAPTTEADVLIKLLKGKQVMEIQRQAEWVNIETGREDIKTGWVHQSLVNKVVQKESPRENPADKRFKIFLQKFNDYNDAIRQKNDIVYFTAVKNNGAGSINVIATQAWLEMDHAARGIALNEVFKLWRDVTPVGSAMSIVVLDEQGEQHMLMLR